MHLDVDYARSYNARDVIPFLSTSTNVLARTSFTKRKSCSQATRMHNQVPPGLLSQEWLVPHLRSPCVRLFFAPLWRFSGCFAVRSHVEGLMELLFLWRLPGEELPQPKAGCVSRWAGVSFRVVAPGTGSKKIVVRRACIAQAICVPYCNRVSTCQPHRTGTCSKVGKLR